LALASPARATPGVRIAFGLTNDRIEVSNHLTHEGEGLLVWYTHGARLFEQPLQVSLSEALVFGLFPDKTPRCQISGPLSVTAYVTYRRSKSPKLLEAHQERRHRSLAVRIYTPLQEVPEFRMNDPDLHPVFQSQWSAIW
jgi:hypothetical protein